jgi:outer membrane protein assembly factor BamB
MNDVPGTADLETGRGSPLTTIMLKLFTLSLLTVFTLSVAAQRAPEWTQWRGPQRDGTITVPLPTTWPVRLTKRWELSVGAGYSSPVVAGDRVVVHARQADREIVRAVSLTSAKELWRDEFPTPYTMNPAARAHGPGPKSTPVIAGSRVVTFGISGVLTAFDLESGKVLWRTPAPSAAAEYGGAMSPIVDGPLLIAYMSGPDTGGLTAFDLASGTVRWRWNTDRPAYASPVIATIGGVKQVITQSEQAVIGVNVADGALLWRIPFTTSFNQNSVTPVVRGDVVIYSGLDSGTTAVRIGRAGGQWTTTPVWKNEQISMYMSTPVVVGSTLYGLSHRNRGQFFAVDVGTGRTLWTTVGREGDNASLVAAGLQLLVTTTNGELIVARPNVAKFEEVKRYTIAESAVWAHPAVLPNAILVKDLDKLTCWNLQ